MSKNMLYSQFSRDLFNLYCKIKKISVEDLFIKFSAAQGKDFISWFKNNERLIKSRMANANVFNAIDMLIDIRQIMPTNNEIDRSYIVKTFLSSPKTQTVIPIIWAIDALLKESKNIDVLLPYSDLITIIATNLKRQGRESKEDYAAVFQDLSVLQELYEQKTGREKFITKKINIKQQKNNMLVALLSKFSEEIALIYDSQGMNDIAQKFREGILAKPVNVGVGKIIKTEMIKPIEFKVIDLLLKEVFKKYEDKWLQYNHDLIEVTLLNRAGEISNEDFYEIKNKYEEDKNIMKQLNNEEESGFNIKIPNDKRINSNFLVLLTIFFNQYRAKII